MTCRATHLVVLGVLLISGCSGSGPQSALDPAGSQAQRINGLWWLFFWVCAGVYGVVVLVLLIAALRPRPKAVTASVEVVVNPETRRERRFAAVVIWALVGTAVILFVFLIGDFQTGRALAALGANSGTNALTIKITGQQWWWQFEYSDPTPSNILRTANEVHIPTGQPVKFELKSTDVIHSFWVPNLHGKKDLIPGYPARVWLQANRPGTFYGQCAEFCGYQHAQMRFVLVAESDEKFKAWRKAQSQAAPQPANDSQKRGQQVFLTGTCAMCHTIQGTDAQATVGPDLTHIASRPMIAAASRPNTRGHIAGWILDPQNIKPGVHMPMHNLPPSDLQALLDYLESLK